MKIPKWLQINEKIMWPIVQDATQVLNDRKGSDLTLNVIPQCAIIHFTHCLEASIQTNMKGQHSTAICLVRQCIESLTIVELGLQELSYGDKLLGGWFSGKKTQGQIRKDLESDIWPNYGKGLWQETWAEYFGNLARAVQPYAHYTMELQGWQFAVTDETELSKNMFTAAIGMNTYDALKASRITLLHSLSSWTLARLLMESDPNYGGFERRQTIVDLGTALSQSSLLSNGYATWPEELMPHLFFLTKPKSY